MKQKQNTDMISTTLLAGSSEHYSCSVAYRRDEKRFLCQEVLLVEEGGGPVTGFD